MKRESNEKWSGFLLLESHIGLAVFSLLSLQMIPLILYVHHQSIKRENQLEAYRFCLELVGQPPGIVEKKSGERYYRGDVLGGGKVLQRLKVSDNFGRLLVDIYEK